jgi:hypothetical protein
MLLLKNKKIQTCSSLKTESWLFLIGVCYVIMQSCRSSAKKAKTFVGLPPSNCQLLRTKVNE